MNLSQHFTLEEMVLSETAARQAIANIPPPDALDHLYELAAQLERIRALFGRPLVISSGYRSPDLNTAIGGSPNSAHVLGCAADFICPPLSPLETCQAIAASDLAFDQLIHEHSWVHFAIGIGPQDRRQVLTLLPGGGYRPGL